MRNTYLFINLIILLIASSQLKAQQYLNDLANIKYYDSIVAPDSNWNSLNLNDSIWKNGGGFIGYGETVDVQCKPVQTLYTRSTFTLDSLTQYKELGLFVDFDDAFAAYINGVQLAKVNLGPLDSIPLHNQLADRSHEKELYRDNTSPVAGYYIDSVFIANNMVLGENVIAIEFHNDSINGSDLFGIGVLFDIARQRYDIFDFFSRYKRCVELDSTHLPIIIIESDEYGIPNKRIEVPAKMGIINNPNGKYNKPTDSYNEYNGAIKIEMRGESSSWYPKKPFDLELQDNQGNDTSVSLLGMPRESDWILQGPFADKSQIRNALVYELGLKTGHWTPRVKYCEVIINGEYVGLYNLIEKIKRDSSRVNVGKLKVDEITGTDLTGGYIFKYDKGDSRIQIVYPKTSDLQPEQENYIRNFMNEYEAKLLSNSGLDPETGYSKYIDEQSLIDYMIVVELTKNCDSYLFSSYLYKDKDDRDGRIKYGPLWDFDLSIGNSIWQDGFKTEGWQFDVPSNNRFRITRLLQDPDMVELFQNRWAELREQFLHTDSLFARIDTLTSQLAKPIERNYYVWPVVDKGLYFPAYIMPTYADEINYMKNWLTARIDWIDNNIGSIHYDTTDYASVNEFGVTADFDAKVYPNPFVQDFYIDMSLPQTGMLTIELINIQGSLVQTIATSHVIKGDYKIYYNIGQKDIPQGIYLVSIKLDGKLLSHVKVVYSK